jgi:hypothetical protein
MKGTCANNAQGVSGECGMRVTHVRFGASGQRGLFAPGSPAADSGAGPGQTLYRGVVADEAGGAWRVTRPDGAGAAVARRAAGCLLAPRPGDLVLVLEGGADEERFILSVLDRASGPSVLEFPGGLEVRAPGGDVLIGSRTFGVEASQEAAIASPRLSLAAGDASMRFGVLDLLARKLEAGLEQVTSACDSVRFAASTFWSRIGRSFGSVGFALTRAKRMRVEVEGRFGVKSGQASILAKDEVTVDADRINIG